MEILEREARGGAVIGIVTFLGGCPVGRHRLLDSAVMLIREFLFVPSWGNTTSPAALCIQPYSVIAYDAAVCSP
jgi:hypothetical protein